MNYDLLRPFDIEAAKHGEEICFDNGEECIAFVAEAGEDDEHAFRNDQGNLLLVEGSELRMKPLAWVEDRPVYKGDVLWQKAIGLSYEVKDGFQHVENSFLTWTKPEPKKDYSSYKVDDPVMVRGSEKSLWIKAHFAYEDNGLAVCWDAGRTSYTSPPTGSKNGWPFCRRPTPDEMKWNGRHLTQS